MFSEARVISSASKTHSVTEALIISASYPLLLRVRNQRRTKKAPRRVPCYKAKLAPFLDLNEAGLPRVYSVYRDVLESATKIVKEFENPKIIKQKEIEFSLVWFVVSGKYVI